jgi:hypothetical protein
MLESESSPCLHASATPLRDGMNDLVLGGEPAAAGVLTDMLRPNFLLILNSPLQSQLAHLQMIRSGFLQALTEIAKKNVVNFKLKHVQ